MNVWFRLIIRYYISKARMVSCLQNSCNLFQPFTPLNITEIHLSLSDLSIFFLYIPRVKWLSGSNIYHLFRKRMVVAINF